MITFDCPGCRATLQAPPQAVGQPIRCPHCHQQFHVPTPVASPAPDPFALTGKQIAERRVAFGCLGVIVVAFLAIVIAGWLDGDDGQRQAMADADAKAAEVEAEADDVEAEPAKPEPPPRPELGTKERMFYEVREALGPTNRGVARFTELEHTADFGLKGNVNVQMAFSSGAFGSNGIIRSEICDLLEAVQDSRVDYAVVFIRGTLPLVDTLGDESETQVVNFVIPRETVERIDFENFNPDNIYEVAEKAIVHPAIRD